MIEEEVAVAEVSHRQVWVEKAQRSACASCEQVCSSSVVDRFFNNRQPKRLQVDTSIALKRGDKVIIGIREDALIRGFLLIYLLPLLALFAGAMGGSYLSTLLSFPTNETLSIAGGLLAFSLCLVIIKRSQVLEHNSLKPVVLRKITD